MQASLVTNYASSAGICNAGVIKNFAFIVVSFMQVFLFIISKSPDWKPSW